MSTIKAINVQHPSASTGLALDANGNANIAGTVVAGSSMGWRNRIINGSAILDQRKAGAIISISSYGYGVDRWGYQCFGGGVWSSQRSTVAPAGSTNSLALTVTSADSSIGSTDAYQLFQKIEGFNIADLGFGTASAQTITLSFWVRSSVTGTYSVGLSNAAFNRGYVGTFAVSAANTWEYKTITVPGDTAGTWVTDNGIGLQLAVDLGSGSASNVTAGLWQAVTTSTLRTSGSVNWVANAGATFYLTNVQLEVGSVATPFERRDYGRETMLAQRYYCTGFKGQTGQCWNSTDAAMTFKFPASMRANPTLSYTGGSVSIEIIGGSQNAQMDTLGVNGSVNQYGARVNSMSGRTTLVIPLDPANSDYARIMALVAAGELTIAPAEPT